MVFNSLLNRSNHEKNAQFRKKNIVDSETWRGTRGFIDPKQQVVETRKDICR